MQKILSWIAFAGGEIILLVAFRLWGAGLPDDIRILDTVVSMLILALFFVDLLIPWVDWRGGSQKRLGSLGLRWFFTWLYAIAAIAVMLLCQKLFGAEFYTQLLIQVVLIIGLVLGFSAAVGASSKVEEIHGREARLLDGRREMADAARRLQELAAETDALPGEFRTRIDRLVEELRFVAPCPTQEAAALEEEFLETLRTVEAAIPDCGLNHETIAKSLSRAERLCSRRKAVHTN